MLALCQALILTKSPVLPHFTDQETEALRGYVTCPVSQLAQGRVQMWAQLTHSFPAALPPSAASALCCSSPSSSLEPHYCHLCTTQELPDWPELAHFNPSPGPFHARWMGVKDQDRALRALSDPWSFSSPATGKRDGMSSPLQSLGTAPSHQFSQLSMYFTASHFSSWGLVILICRGKGNQHLYQALPWLRE